MGLFSRKIRWWQRVERGLLLILEEIYHMQKALNDLEKAVQQQTTVIDSATTLLTELAGTLRANAADQAKIEKIADEVEANSQRLAEALAKGTEADPEAADEA